MHDDRRYVAVWLTKAESRDATIRASLPPLFAEWNQKKYKIVVFESGERDLAEQTKALLAHSLEVSTSAAHA